MAPVAWWRLGVIGSGFAALALIGGLVVFAHDGRIATYVAMVLATAASLWWFGLRPLRR